MPNQKDLTDLREHIFDVIDKVKNRKLDIDTARTIGDLAQVMVNSMKVEMDMIIEFGGGGTGFIPLPPLKGRKQIGNK